jgi:endonuclease YncB( thermonuclease family)
MCEGWGATLPLTSRAKPTYKITVPHVIRLLLLFALPLAICSLGSAASLQGEVAELVDGEPIAVVSANHLLKVRLIAVAAPEQNQSLF